MTDNFSEKKLLVETHYKENNTIKYNKNNNTVKLEILVFETTVCIMSF